MRRKRKACWDDSRPRELARTTNASWHSSDEPKAVATASALTDDEVEVEVVPMLGEAVRTDWSPPPEQHQFQAAALAAFARPADAAHPGWEPFDQVLAAQGGRTG